VFVTPKGIICCVWEDRTGVRIIEKYPNEIINSINNDDILTLFTTHALSGEAGILSMSMSNLSFISYYTGKPKEKDESQFILALILAKDENPAIFEEYLSAIAEIVIKSVEKEGFKDFLIDYYEVASHTKEISEEQYRSFLLRDDISNFIIELLRDGPITKKELIKYLSKILTFKIRDINKFLKPLLKNNLLVEHSISLGPRVTLEYLLMIKDLDIIRAPPLNILFKVNSEQSHPELKDPYQKALVEFFENYKPSPDDYKKLIEFMSNPGTYEIIKVLRQEYVKSKDLTLKIGFTMRNLYSNIEKLTDSNIILPIKDNSQQIWLFLLSDILTMEIYPEYLADIIYKNWKNGLIEDDITIEHLERLRIEYGKQFQLK